jgi:hypothetical protein
MKALHVFIFLKFLSSLIVDGAKRKILNITLFGEGFITPDNVQKKELFS